MYEDLLVKWTSASLNKPFLYNMRVLGSNLSKIINFYFCPQFCVCFELKINGDKSAGLISVLLFYDFVCHRKSICARER